MSRKKARRRAANATEAHKKAVREGRFKVLDENPLLDASSITDNPYMQYATHSQRWMSKRHPYIGYVTFVAIALTAVLGFVTYKMKNAVVNDITDVTQVRTVSLANPIPAADFCDAMVKVEKDPQGRPTIRLRITPKTDMTADVWTAVSATIEGTTDEGDTYEQVIKNIPCDSPDTHVFSRDGMVCVQGVSSMREVTLWPNFDGAVTKGTVKKLKHIDVDVSYAQPSTSVVDAIAPEQTALHISLENEGKQLHLSGSVANRTDTVMKNARVLITTRSITGECPVGKTRDDIPWVYGCRSYTVSIGDIPMNETAHIDEVIDISDTDVTRASVAAVVADTYQP